MENRGWKIGNITFSNEEEYITAKNDMKAISTIITKVDLKKPDNAKKLYNILKEDTKILKSKKIKEVFLNNLVTIFIKDSINKQEQILNKSDFDEVIYNTIYDHRGVKRKPEGVIQLPNTLNEKKSHDIIFVFIMLVNISILLITNLYRFDMPIVKSIFFWKILGNMWFASMKYITFINFCILILIAVRFIVEVIKKFIRTRTINLQYIVRNIFKCLLVLILMLATHKIKTNCDNRTMFDYIYSVINSGDSYFKIYQYMRKIIFGIGY